MKYIILFILIILILIILSYCFYCYKHSFWSKQPVSNWFYFNFKDTVITNKLPYKYNLPKNISIYNYNIDNINLLKKYHKFLKSNYEEQINGCDLKLNFFLWTLNYPNQNKPEIISLNKNNEIIGTITSKSFYLKINNNIIKTSYVDYLCINKKERNKNMAPILISNMAELGFKNTKSFIFKKEDTSLPFRYITKYNYYYSDIKNLLIFKKSPFSNIEELNNDNLTDVYNFYSNFCKNNFNLYRLYTLAEFKYYFLKNNFYSNCKLYIYKESNLIKGLISFYDYYCKNLLNTVNYQIKFIFGINENIIFELFEYFILLKKNKNSKIIISNTGMHNVLINKYNFIKDMTCFIHMYNYHIMYPIDKKKVCLYFV